MPFGGQAGLSGLLLTGLALAPRAGPGDGGEDALGERALRVLSLDVLGRPPYRAEWDAWLGRPRAAWVEAFVCDAEGRASEEFWRQWLDAELYELLLVDEFRPPVERLDGWVADLAAGRVGVVEALHRILLSTEFDRRNPGADTFVTVVMEELLGVKVQDSVRDLERGKELYDGGAGSFLGVRGSSQADVVRIAVADPRTPRNLVARAHRRLLGTELEGRELARAAASLDEGPGAFPRLAAGWLTGGDWPARLARREPVDNRRFVRALYVDLLDRLPDEDETRRMRTALDGLADPRPLRAILVRLMLDSGRTRVPGRTGELADPAAFVDGSFERLLGRAPDDAERTAFLEVLSTPGARPETLLLALLSHPEYQTW